MKLLLLSLILAPVLANASSITLSNSPVGPQVVSNSGVLIGNGQLVKVGYFENVADLTTFREFGNSVTASVGPGTSRPTGLQTNLGGEADDAQFNGKDVYLWIYNSPTASATADQGIFRANGAATPWTFPNDGGATDGVTLSVAAVNLALSPIGFSGAAVIAAGQPGNPSTTNPVFKLAAVPEPTAGVFTMLALGLLATRRKR